MLLGAAAIGRASGLRYVYAGNLPGQVGDLEDTRCAACGELLIARYGYHIRAYRVTAGRTLPVVCRGGSRALERRIRGAGRRHIPFALEFRILGSEF